MDGNILITHMHKGAKIVQKIRKCRKETNRGEVTPKQGRVSCMRIFKNFKERNPIQ